MQHITALEEQLGAHATNAEIQSIYNDLFTDQHRINGLLARPLPPADHHAALACREAVETCMRVLAKIVIDNRRAARG